MRFTYAETMCDPTFLAPLAVAAEDAGFHSLSIPDSIMFPATTDASYPYVEDGGREWLENKPMIEPMILMAYLAGQTSRIRFTTFVVKLAVRPAVLVAKQAASIAVLSNNRLSLGVGLSPWPEDFEVLGQPWRARGARMSEQIQIIKGLMGGDYFEFHGEHLDLPPIKLCPVPTAPLPVLVGGHADAALVRAAQLGDGWMHGGGDPADLPGLIERVTALRKEHHGTTDGFEIHAISLDAYSRDGVKRLEDAGVTDAVVGFRYPYTTEPDAQSLEDKVTALSRFADQMIS
ncbi:MAG: TIGR03619 family F420-dependent LLM class oxidoreductase [Acidimicrobiia bacterium]